MGADHAKFVVEVGVEELSQGRTMPVDVIVRPEFYT